MVREAIQPREFFISRAGNDKGIAAAIATIIRGAGHSTWLQDEDFGHASFMARMEQGFEMNARVIVLLSSSYQSSDYCRKEYNVALIGDPLNLKQRLIVLRVEDCAPTGNLRDIAYIDLVPILGNADHLARVVRAAIGSQSQQADVEFANIYRRSPQQILHREIDEVPGFTGRETELELLERTLWTKGAAALTNANSPSAAVRGLGGVGKSVLAREYAWRKRARYCGAWWLRAEKRETLLDDLIELGARFIPGIRELPEREQAARATLDFIDQAGFEKPWLIVYDNVEQPGDIARLTPRAGAHILITTRWSDWYGQAAELPVDVFTPEVAVDFLMEHARCPDAQAAGRLAASLGYLPLALSHARSYCWAANWGFDQYRANLTELVHKAPRGAPYPATVFATFDLAIEKAIVRCKEANELMGVLALVSADRLPLDVISTKVMSEITRGEAVAALSEVSLISLDILDDGVSSCVSVHRLVQEVMRGRLSIRTTFAEAAAVATKLLATALAPEKGNPHDVRSWPACARLLPHALAVLQYAPESGPDNRFTVNLMSQTALYLNGRADFATAEPMMRRAISLSETNSGLENSDLPTLLQNLAGLLYDTGRYDEAVHLIERAIKVDEMHQGALHSDVASGLNALAELYRLQGRFDEGVALQERALAILEKAHGPEHPYVATSLINLAGLYLAQGRHDDAAPLYERALAITEKALGPEHPNLAMSLNNVATLYVEQGRYDDAAPLCERALAIMEKALGPEHPDVAVSLSNQAMLYHKQGRYDDAAPLCERALAIMEKALGPEHPNVALCLMRTGELYLMQGRYDEAASFLERAKAICEKALGPEHPYVAVNLGNLALVYLNQGRYEDAEPLCERALAIMEKALGPEHPDLARGLTTQVSLYEKQGRYDDAAPLCERALAIMEKALGPEHPDLARGLTTQVSLYEKQGRYDDAAPLCERALTIMEKALGPEHPEVATILNNEAVLYSRQGRYDDAAPLCERALAIREKALGLEHADVATSLSNLAKIYLYQGRYDDVEPLYERALAIMEKAFGSDHPATKRVRESLASEQLSDLLKRLEHTVGSKTSSESPSIDEVLRNLQNALERSTNENLPTPNDSLPDGRQDAPPDEQGVI
jgi:tetratricopeptide (TPR) repeat protein